MDLLWNINELNESKLKAFGFEQSIGNDSGMRKAYEWSNEIMSFGLYYDRGYFDCSVCSLKATGNSIALIQLLRKIKADDAFYAKELEAANLWNTLEPNDYFELLFQYYKEIELFFKQQLSNKIN